MNKKKYSKNILIEFKKDSNIIISNKIKTSEKLVKALTIVRTFDWLDKIEWIESELYGYDEKDSIPGYRNIPYSSDSLFRRTESGRVKLTVGVSEFENWIKDIQEKKMITNKHLGLDQIYEIGSTQEYVRIKIEDLGNVNFFLSHLESILGRIDTILSDIASEIIVFCNTELDQSSISLRKELDNSNKEETLENLKILFTHFHEIAVQLRSRHNDRATLDIEDEYDIQDLLHALFKLYFNDIRKEEPVPSSVGSSARMDFLLKEEQIGIEVKKSSKNMNEKKIGSELIEDIIKYQKHPYCKTLV